MHVDEMIGDPNVGDTGPASIRGPRGDAVGLEAGSRRRRADRPGGGSMTAVFRRLGACLVAAAVSVALPPPAAALVQRDEVGILVGPYNLDFFNRHNFAYRTSAAVHYAHGRAHDVLQLTPLDQHAEWDAWFDNDMVTVLANQPRIEPTMETYGPFVGRAMWNLYLAIDWTHHHHEQTYDILSSREVPWDEKKRWTDRAVRYYLEMVDVARSPAPLDVTMRRAAVMMKPYFTMFRNAYPQSNNYFYWAHWWHPVIYESMMIAGNGDAQDKIVAETGGPVSEQVLKNRPLRMLLSREAMPRYSRLSPESANIFDNLHMLHGIAYDILAYEGWSIEEKRAEMYRVIQAMAYHPGDEALVRKFPLPHPDMDPRVYAAWMQGTDGEMSRIMREMLDEMMPMMSPGGMSPEMHARVIQQFEKKMRPGMQPGEHPGSLADALRAEMGQMPMEPAASAPGETPQMMVEVMLAGWRQKYADMPDVPAMPMNREPSPPVEGGSPSVTAAKVP